MSGELRLLTGRSKIYTILEDKNEKCKDYEICARKCCPDRMEFNLIENACRSTRKKFQPPLWPYLTPSQRKAVNGIRYLKGHINCEQSLGEERKLVTDITTSFYLNIDGKLFVESYQAMGPELYYNTDKYCLDFFTDDEKTEMNAYICYVKNKFERKFVLTGSCMLLTCFLVLLRVIAFAWLPELRTLHGMILMAYLVSFLVGFLLLGSKMLLLYSQKMNREACVILAYVVYFAILSAFFWRNVMCYDIWWTFSGKRGMAARGAPSRTRLYFYCIYAFGGPSVLTILLATLENIDDTEGDTLMPKLQRHGCNSLHGLHKLLYFYAPIMMLFVINIIFFTLTALKIAAIKKQTKMIFNCKESGTTYDQKNAAQRRFILYVKLFATMVFLEVNWILEIISIFYPEAEVIVQITDAYNVVILIIILVNFLCQKRTWQMIKKRYPNMRGVSSGQTAVVSTSRMVSQISQVSQLDDTQSTCYAPKKTKPAESKYDIQSTDYSHDDIVPAEGQDNTQSINYIQEKTYRAECQDNIQSMDYSRENKNSVKRHVDAQSIDHRGNKMNPAENPVDTQSIDYSRENPNPTESHADTQSIDHSRNKMNPAEDHVNTESIDCSRESTSLAESHTTTQSIDHSRNKMNPAEYLVDTQSIDCSRESTNLAESHTDTQSIDHSRNKMNPAEDHVDTQSIDCSRKSTNPAKCYVDTQAFDYSRNKMNPAENHVDSQSIGYSQENTNPAEGHIDTRSIGHSREKTNPAESQNDTLSTNL